MAEWNENPSWNGQQAINNGEQYSPNDTVTPEDMNAFVENMQYLYSRGGNFEVNPYAVGSIYMSTDSTSPAYLFGGSWQRIQDKFLVASGSKYLVGSTGGSESHYHDAGTLGATLTMSSADILIASEKRDGLNYMPTARIKATSRETPTNRTDYIVPVLGVTSTASNIPPYLAVYIWKRIS